jgi:acyl carrier protein
MSILESVRAYIQENFLYMRPDLEFGDEDSLLGAGIVDSMGVMEVIAFLEDEFGVVVADEDITEENLGTLKAIARYASERGAKESQVA